MLSTINNVIQSLWNKAKEISKPSPKYMKDNEEFELAHNRNKTLLLINSSACVSFIISIALDSGGVSSNIQGIVGALFISITMVMTNKLHINPQIFKMIFNFYCFAFAFLYMDHEENGIIGTILAAPVYSIIVYFLTGSMGHFLIHIGCHMLFLNTIGEEIMQKNLTFLSVEEIIQAFTYFSNQNVIYIFITTAFIHYVIQSAVYKIRVVEEKKASFERQKNFLLGFSHELRNLINSLMGNVKLASLEDLSEKVKDLLLNAEVCSELLIHLVNNILDTGKVEIGELEVNPVPTRVYDTVERIWSICSELIKRKNLRGKMKLQNDIPQVLMLDHYRITQMFLNLIGNAVKFTDSGSINISVEWLAGVESVGEACFKPYPFNDSDEQDEGLFEKEQALSFLSEKFVFLNFSRKKIDKSLLSPKTSNNKGVLKISVSDTGCGILREDINKLFQRFTQGTSDPSKKKLGTGLGLFITKELCQKMNGDVRVYSKQGKGSTFIVCLPVQPVINDVTFSFDLEGTQRAMGRQRKLRAMVVDDERLSHSILRDFLTKMHVDVVDIAENGQIAYQKYMDHVIRENYINIVTMDLTMPVMDGKTAAQKIREFEAARNLSPCLLLIVSGNCTESEIKECLDKNGSVRADAFVKKPVSIDELCRIISYYFAQSCHLERDRSASL